MQAAKSAFRLNPVSWPLLLGGAIFAAYLAIVIHVYQDGFRAAKNGEAPLFTDYTSLYAASLLVRREEASQLYFGRAMYAATLEAAQAAYDGTLSEGQARRVGFAPWLYPPIFIFFALPLAYLSYLASYVGWLAATALPYLAAMRTILRDQWFWLLALASPPVFFNVMYGQTGFLTAGLIGLGLALIPRRPLVAGILIGLASCKPHFGVLIPFALVAARQWRTFVSAALTVVVLALASALAFGIDSWYGFIGSAGNSVEGFQAGAYKWKVLSSVLGLLHSLGLRAGLAWYGQIIAAFCSLLLVVWAWRGSEEYRDLRCAILCAATLLAVPMVYLYDLMLIVPAMAWLWSDMQKRGAARWEPALLTLCGAALLGLREFAWATGVQPGAVLVAVMLWLAVRRLENARSTALSGTA